MSIVIVTGPPGAGKSTVARSLAGSYPLGVHLVADDCFHWIAAGYVPPWLPDSESQNATVMSVIGTASAGYAAGGYDVVVDGIVGPWFLDRFLDAVGDVVAVSLVSYVVLRPARSVARARAMGRIGVDDFVDTEPVDAMYSAFEDLGEYESHVVDTSDQDAASVLEIQVPLARGDFALRPTDR